MSRLRVRGAELARRYYCCKPKLWLLVAVLLWGAISVLVLYSVFHLQAVDNARRAAQRSVNELDSMLTSAESANQAILPLLDEPCMQEALLHLRKIVATVPYIRSANLIRQQQIYCSSLLGATSYPDKLENFDHHRLLLAAGNVVQQQHAFLALRTEQGHSAALSTIDENYLVKALLHHLPERDMIWLRVGAKTLNPVSQSSEAEAGWFKRRAVVLADSALFPFSIEVSYPVILTWQEGLAHRLWLMIGWGGSIVCMLCLVMYFRRSLYRQLVRAANGGQFIPVLQPIVASHSNRLTGTEVLMRWQHPTRGMLRPDAFISQAEQSGLIVPMTLQLMQTVACELGQSCSLLPAGFHIAFNISAAHCKGTHLFEACWFFLVHFPLGAVTLVLELTERELLVDDAYTILLFHQLEELGVKFAVDDFGTGYATLSYLKQFNISYLKIDRTFVNDGEHGRTEALIDNIMDLAERLKLTTIAEGIESQQQAIYMKAKGVQYFQGFLYSPPLSICQFRLALLERTVPI